jgi:capsid protein
MSIFSRIKAVFTGKPKKGAVIKASVDYDGVRTSRFYGAKFSGGLPYPAPNLMLDSEGIRQQVRVLSHNSLQLRALLERDVDTVVAQGLNLSPEPKHEILGLKPEEAEAWSSAIKQRFELWAMSQRSSRNSMYNFFQAQRLMRKSLFRDGELFVLLSYHNDPSLLSPLKFQIIDPSQIREQGFTFTGTGFSPNTTSREGIVRNADGEEVAYKVWVNDAHGIPKETVIPRVGISGRLMVLHAMTNNDYAGQLRGISPFAVCAQDLENILDYTLAQVEKAKNQSNIVFTVESDTEDAPNDPFKNLSDAGAGPQLKKAVEQYGATPAPDPNAQNVTEEALEIVCNDIPHRNVRRPGAMIVVHPKGKQRLKASPDTAPSANFNDFVKTIFSYVAAATGQSVETVLMLFNNNYSASRATLILTWRIAEQRRWEWDYYVGGPMYEMWLAEEIAAGRVSCPGWADPRLRAAWTAHRYNGLSMPVIDPVKTMQAAKMALEVSATTLEDTSQEYNDSDFEANCIKNREGFKNLPKPPWNTGKDGAKNSETDNGQEEEEA